MILLVFAGIGDGMKRRLVIWAGALACLSLAFGCGSRSSIPNVSEEAVKAEAARQVAFGFETMIEESARLQSVAFRILTANADQCGTSIASQYGMSLLTLENLDDELHEVARQRLGLDNQVTVVQTVKGSPARRAGLAPGDRIVSLGGREINQGARGMEQVARILRRARPPTALKVTVYRRARKLSFPLRPVHGCAAPVILSGLGDDEDLVDSGAIVVHRGTLRLAANDDELALVVAHELGHIVARHLRIRGDDADGFMAGFPIAERIPASPKDTSGDDGRGDFSEKEELDADYLGLYFAARAGFATDKADIFWRKVAREDPDTLGFAKIHPTSPRRLLVIGQYRDEIALKRQSGGPLLPAWPRL